MIATGDVQGSKNCDDYVKVDFSNRTKDLTSGSITEEAALAQAISIAKDMGTNYAPWSASWLPLAMGGYYSSLDIMNQLGTIINKSLPKYANKGIAAVSKLPVPGAITQEDEDKRRREENPCKKKAEDMFGWAAQVPGLAAPLEKAACDWDKYKTRLYIAAGLVSILVVMGAIGGIAIIFRPYASLASTAFSKRRPKRKK